MKKALLLMLIILLIFSICGCKTQKDIENASSISSYVTAIKIESDDEKTESLTENIEETASVNTSYSNTATASEKTQSTENQMVCIHSYRKETVGVSCSTDGYMKYTCSKCGDTYNGETVPAGHDFSKYLCERCGKIDPQCDVFWGINDFLSKYGTINGKGNLNCYPNATAALCLSNYLDQKQFMISIEDYNTTTSISAYIDTDFTNFSYRKGSTYGYFEVKNSAFSLDNTVIFDEFGTNSESPVDEDVFATECAVMLRTLFSRAENEILIPKTGLTFASFGFRI